MFRIVATSGQVVEIRRVSYEGELAPVAVLPGQPVTVILDFGQDRAGEPLTVAPLDGGSLLPPELGLTTGGSGSTAALSSSDLTVAADGTAMFTFQPGTSLGLYRVGISSTQYYVVHVYVVSPAPQRPLIQVPPVAPPAVSPTPAPSVSPLPSATPQPWPTPATVPPPAPPGSGH